VVLGELKVMRCLCLVMRRCSSGGINSNLEAGLTGVIYAMIPE